MLLTTGERVSMALLAMALHDLGVEAISFTGSQSGVLTDGTHGAARITGVKPDRILEELAKKRVVIVAGFQGVNPVTKEITTLGRGGSDTTAVALAAALGAAAPAANGGTPPRCEICTDVPGVLTADPRVVPAARPLSRISFRACSALARLGGKVLHPRCVELAARHRVPLTVRSSFDESPGTEIVEDEMEQPRVDAVAHRTGLSLAIAEGNAAGKGEPREMIEAVADAYPELELLAHEQANETHGVIVWLGSREDAEALEKNFRALRGPGNEWKLTLQHGAAFVSAVGLGLGAREAARAERALEKAGIALHALRTSPGALVFRVPDDRAADAARVLHAALIETPVTSGAARSI
jgi:aspartate kinase